MKDLPDSALTPDEARVLGREWHYIFRLPSGRQTPSYMSDDVTNIHHTRLAMMWSVLDPLFKGKWQEVRAIDIGCNEGWFASHLAARGCAEVCGVDARLENVEHASLMTRVLGHKRTRYVHGEVQELTPELVGYFDVSILFGILHRVDNPVAAIRRVRALTRRICLVEAQVAPDLEATMVWGFRDVAKRSKGIFLLIDGADEMNSTTGSLTEITLCPSTSALVWLMQSAGFTRVQILTPPAGGWEQHTTGQRVMVAGYCD